MKHCVLITLLAVALGGTALAQQGPDEQYVMIYGMIGQADALADAGQPQQAREEYRAALAELQKFAKIYPAWSPNIITFRENYLANKIAAASVLLPAENPAEAHAALPAIKSPDVQSTAGQPPVANIPAQVIPAPDARLTAQLADLQAQVQSLQEGNATLAAKLREALAVQPAAADPRELAAAQERVRSLMKENDLLKVSLSQAQKPVDAANWLSESNALSQARLSLADMGRKLSLAMAQASQLSVENQALHAQAKTLLESREGVEALRQENALLKKQLAEARAGATAAAEELVHNNDQLRSDLAAAQAQVAKLLEAARKGGLERTNLEARIHALELAAAHPATAPVIVAPPAPPVARQGPAASVPTVQTTAQSNALAADEARIKELEKERDELRLKLVAAGQLWGGNQTRSLTNVLVIKLTQQLETLQARLAVYEAKRVPYTAEELALFRQSAPGLKPPGAAKPAIHEVPPELAASAEAHFSAHEYDQAAGDYQKILEHDENNGLALANLAVIDMRQGHLPEAEKHVLAAVALSPEDAYNQSVLGRLRFLQNNYSAAVDSLSRAVELDPRNAEYENLLGVALGHQGLRTAAETALRKALLLDSTYADANNNLAVIYLTEQPPQAELARWHYLKALASGLPHNPGMEKVLADNGAAVPPP